MKTLLIGPDTSIKQAMQKLSETAERILFVTDEQGKVLGTVTDGDIRRRIIHGVSLTDCVPEVMNAKFLAVQERCQDIRGEARSLMQQHLVERIPVLNEDGVITDVILSLDYLHLPSIHEKKPITSHIPVVIMAGGKGTRLDPFTRILPKPLIPLGKKPIIEHITDRFHQHGFSRFLIIVNYKKEMIRSYFSENRFPYTVEF
ncbi:MAG: CBS domain-containing protein, partial [bacterium]|nr:CBS domain-containing protein [bacterium]